ncbi:unnamed protein product [Zymoseptoria tritici ST99CH_3D1]|uniref:DUF3074 domain-containing protein n=1 Tax=Zymoseptoria tritici (strain ST99CH_3D7) TaxID=1276538 RepID=A0A1X7REQ2_ZYMT9|nr:unnamed protein product [Zymoseptoria tritici ST99CH_3D7]SMR44404.1 unnamed protein product [Zymoseptoria tritici ST99CH_3D1]
MAELHEALEWLSPTDWSDVPTDNLEPYLKDAFAAGELICNSVPPLPNGTPFNESKPHHDTPNTATSHKDMHPSTVLSPPPLEEHENLQKGWGKPYKMKDNALGVQIYKMAAKDRHGAWFARKSVHEGLGFDKMKRAMMREFPHSMSIKGGPGAGAVRGIAADTRLERSDLPGVGKLEVYQLSAQFPGPTTPREFITLLLSSDEALSEKSAAKLADGKTHAPRHFMLVSKPVEHPNSGSRSGFVRGKYESVELIREIPLSTAKPKSTPHLRGSDEKNDPTEGSEEPELNPVEWIMITRSDPGGGLPRFLIERGTPDSMLGDVHKFFDWACSQGEIAHPDEDLVNVEENAGKQDEVEQPSESLPNGTMHSEPVPATADGANADTSTEPTASSGILSNVSKAIETYAPASVANMIVQPSGTGQYDSDTDSDSSTASSADSFISADETKRASAAPGITHVDSMDALSIKSGESETSKNMSRHEKEVQKLVQKREKLDQQLAKKRLADEAKLRQAKEKDDEEASKQKDKIERELAKTEEKHKKEVEKLEAKQAKEAKKAEDKRKKKDDQTKLSMVTRERDEFRSQSDLLRQENAALQAQIAELQAQNSTMAQTISNKALSNLDLGRARSDSLKSTNSKKSN